ncbi:MAG: outer membrane protein OmpA-like peptidoglycan-associated protein [Gammaproteobacteria bacterium]|jgi:outer membrane protein OmpA-like peptidoglycan-associated protein
MSKLIITGFIALCLFNIVAHADPVSHESEAFKHKEKLGIGIGAIIGGLIAGPPGAIIGMASGIWMGGNDKMKDEKISSLNIDLIEKQTNLAISENRLSDLQTQYGNELQKVSARNHTSSLEALSNGVSLAVYFRTESADIDAETQPRIQKLAEFLTQFPEIKLLIEGYADRRGTTHFNRQLGLMRTRAVETALIQAGIEENRILTHSYGESQAKAVETDIDGILFDRKVNITLTLDTQL